MIFVDQQQCINHKSIRLLLIHSVWAQVVCRSIGAECRCLLIKKGVTASTARPKHHYFFLLNFNMELYETVRDGYRFSTSLFDISGGLKLGWTPTP